MRQLRAAVRHAQRLSDRIRSRMAVGVFPEDGTEEGLAIVAIRESSIRATRRHLIRHSARS